MLAQVQHVLKRVDAGLCAFDERVVHRAGRGALGGIGEEVGFASIDKRPYGVLSQYIADV